MGTWSLSIMGGDTAMDLKSEYKIAFANNSPEKAVEILDQYCKTNLCADEMYIYYYSLALFMWENGVLTKKVKDKAIEWIDGEKDLELYAEQGEKTLETRKKVLQELKEKLNSPMPAKKDLKGKPVFSFKNGDLIAIQIKFCDPWYLEHYFKDVAPELVEKYADYYVVTKKVCEVKNPNAVPELRKGVPLYVMYDYLSKDLPSGSDIANMKIISAKERIGCEYIKASKWFNKTGVFITYPYGAKGDFHWKKRNYQIVGNDLKDCKKILRGAKWRKFRIRGDAPEPVYLIDNDLGGFIMRRLLQNEIIQKNDFT